MQRSRPEKRHLSGRSKEEPRECDEQSSSSHQLTGSFRPGGGRETCSGRAHWHTPRFRPFPSADVPSATASPIAGSIGLGGGGSVMLQRVGCLPSLFQGTQPPWANRSGRLTSTATAIKLPLRPAGYTRQPRRELSPSFYWPACPFSFQLLLLPDSSVRREPTNKHPSDCRHCPRLPYLTFVLPVVGFYVAGREISMGSPCKRLATYLLPAHDRTKKNPRLLPACDWYLTAPSCAPFIPATASST